MATTNALALARLIESVSTDLSNGKQSGGRCSKIEVSAFVLEKEKFVEVLFHHNGSVTGETDCLLWLDSDNALSLSHLIASGKSVADWLDPRLRALE